MKKSEIFIREEIISFEHTMLNDLATRVRSTKYGTVNIFMYATKQQVSATMVSKFLGASLTTLAKNVVNTNEHKASFIWLNNGTCIPVLNVKYVEEVLGLTVAKFLEQFISDVVEICSEIPKFKEADILLTNYVGTVEWQNLRNLVKSKMIDASNINLLQELRMGVDLSIAKDTVVQYGAIKYYITDEELVISEPVARTYKLTDLL